MRPDLSFLDQSAAAEWERFAGDLTACLGHLQEDEFLILIAKRTGLFVQFAGQGAFGMRAEAVGNQFIEDPTALLTAEQFAAMANIGWNQPTNQAPRFFGDEPPDGSPNFYQDLAPPVDLAALASRAVRTLREVYGVRHPGELVYKSFDEGGASIRFPTLRLQLERG